MSRVGPLRYKHCHRLYQPRIEKRTTRRAESATGNFWLEIIPDRQVLNSSAAINRSIIISVPTSIQWTILLLANESEDKWLKQNLVHTENTRSNKPLRDDRVRYEK